VISVGNLEVGGSGKTPFSRYLIEELSRRKHRPVYVSRGYRSQAERSNEVTIVLPVDADPRGWVSSGVRILRRDRDGLSEIVGDEGAMVSCRCPNVPLAFCGRKRRAMEVVSSLFRPTHVVLDDAFQSWSVERDVDIVLLDAARPLGNGRVLPAGSLREGRGALQRAHVIGFNGISGESAIDEHSRWVFEAVGRAVPIFGVRRQLAFLEDGAAGSIPRGSLAALSSVGRPLRFEASLAAHGVEIGFSLRFPDHYRYREADVRLIEREMASRGIGALVTTEKDWVKFDSVGAPRMKLWIARLDLEMVGTDPVLVCEKPQALPAASA
jgi:tetraacyldisaccharide 4'-kinase